MSVLRYIWQSLYSPKLYMIYFQTPKSTPYEPNVLEKWSDNVVTVAVLLWKVGIYFSPLFGYYMHKKEYFSNTENMYSLLKTVTQVGCGFATAVALRAVGRGINHKYAMFLTDLTQYELVKDKTILRKYDYDFKFWPVSYTQNTLPNSIKFSEPKNNYSESNSKILWLAGHVAVKTFGLSLIYPGSIPIVNAFLGNILLTGRQTLVESHNGKRNKLRTYLNNNVDTMFIDQRDINPNGSTLVICCEGNAGFYEIGIMTTPLKAGYSVLGWNTPGFGGSTARPYPDRVEDAINTVIQFANNELGFPIENITIFAWSIGGYPAAWAVANYPNLQALILDATFDDLLPLAIEKMPKSWEPLVAEVIRKHVNLNIAELVTEYQGPILIVRRTEDEIITLKDGNLLTNRGNDLLKKLLQKRYNFTDSQCSILNEYLSEDHSDGHIIQYSNQVLKLASKYLKDFKSTHCTPLPADDFSIPSRI